MGEGGAADYIPLAFSLTQMLSMSVCVCASVLRGVSIVNDLEYFERDAN